MIFALFMPLAMPLEKMATGDEGESLRPYFADRGCIKGRLDWVKWSAFPTQTYSELKTTSLPVFMSEHPDEPASKMFLYMATNDQGNPSTYDEGDSMKWNMVMVAREIIDWGAEDLGKFAGPFISCPVEYSAGTTDDVLPGDSVAVHGDPMFQHDGKGQHFWLKEGVFSPLLDWTSDDGHKMSLQGLIVANAETGHQWFKQIAFVRDGKQVFDAKAGFSTKPVLAMSGDDVLPDLASRNTTAVLDVSTKFVGPKALQKAVQVIKAGGMTFELTAESAHKFADAAQQSKYAHVNVKMPHGLAKDATGLFAELAGAEPMSEATKALLRSPK